MKLSHIEYVSVYVSIPTDIKVIWIYYLLLINPYKIMSGLRDSNGMRSHNHLVLKRALNHLAKLAEWFSCVVSTYL